MVIDYLILFSKINNLNPFAYPVIKNFLKFSASIHQF